MTNSGASARVEGPDNDVMPNSSRFSKRRAAACLTVLSFAAGLVAAPAGAASTCTIVGTAEADVLRGTRGDDVICGLGGADTLYGGGGSDRLLGGPGRDVLSGGGGNDALVGGDREDRLAGGSGDDTLTGGAGVDTIDFSAATGRVVVSLPAGTATGSGSDSINGVESVVGSPSGDDLVGDGGRNRLVGGEGDDVLRAGGGADALVAGAGDDDMFGGGHNDKLSGGPGDDMLDGGSGSNACDGGAGNDILKPTCDSTAPRIRTLAVSPATVDTSDGPASIMFDAHVTDDLAGVLKGGITVRGPSSQYRYVAWYAYSLVSGDHLDGVYRVEVILPQYSAQGTWTVSDVWVWDTVGNYRSLWTAEQLEQAGLNVSFQQLGAGDVTAPQMRSLTSSPAVIDTSTGPATVVVEARITDAIAGLRFGHAIFRSPSRDQSAKARFNESSRVSGTDRDGIYRYEVTVPQYAERGVWTVDWVHIRDHADNTRDWQYQAVPSAGFDLKFEQTAPGDTTAPVLRSVSFSPTTISTADADAKVVVEARITDAVAGLQYAEISVCDSAKTHGQTGSLSESELISGTIRDGVYRAEITIPRYSATGTWSICWVELHDRAGNRRDASSFTDPTATFSNTP